MTSGSAIPDEYKASKIILGDYIDGHILHFRLSEKHNEERKAIFKEEMEREFPVWEKIQIKNTNSGDLNYLERNKQNFHDDVMLQRDLLREKQKEFFESVKEDDIMELMEGRKVRGYKLNKGQRRELKFMIMQNTSEEKLREALTEYLFSGLKNKKK